MTERGNGKHEFTLELEDRCIESAARSRIREIVSALLDADTGAEDDRIVEMEMLKRFVKRTNFPELRSERPELLGRLRLSVVLSETDTGQFIIRTSQSRETNTSSFTNVQPMQLKEKRK